MSNQLPTRPNMDHLRAQAKDLLAAFRLGSSDAITSAMEFLPSLKGKTETETQTHKLTLSDAQSIIARQYGFVSWKHISRFVDGLRAIEGLWHFTSLIVDGSEVPETMYAQASMSIDGTQFAMFSPGGDYKGNCMINVEVVPHTIDIHFTEGNEKGNTSYGIYRYDGRELTFCLGLTGVERPKEFVSTPSSGIALETLRRAGRSFEGIAATEQTPQSQSSKVDAGYLEINATIAKLQGTWVPVAITMDGNPLPASYLDGGNRVMKQTETTVNMFGKIWLQALTKINDSGSLIEIDYLHTHGTTKGQTQLGIVQIEQDQATFCMGKPGGERPKEFVSRPGTGHTLSVWKLASS